MISPKTGVIMRIALIGLFISMCAAAAHAQYPFPDERPDDREQAVMNEDGGRSFIVRPASGSLTGLLKPGASQSLDLQQYSIFLGPGWSDSKLRSSEDRLSKLLTNVRDHAQLDEIASAGMTNVYAPTWTFEKLDVAGNRNIGDLEIQNIVRDIVKNGARPSGDAMFIVYLDPSLHSTLGPLQANKHYMSYHGYVNITGLRIHYAVVPYQSDAQAAYQTALRTLIVAALHSPTNDSP
jgi:hypothetical protein